MGDLEPVINNNANLVKNNTYKEIYKLDNMNATPKGWTEHKSGDGAITYANGMEISANTGSIAFKSTSSYDFYKNDGNILNIKTSFFTGNSAGDMDKYVSGNTLIGLSHSPDVGNADSFFNIFAGTNNVNGITVQNGSFIFFTKNGAGSEITQIMESIYPNGTSGRYIIRDIKIKHDNASMKLYVDDELAATHANIIGSQAQTMGLSFNSAGTVPKMFVKEFKILKSV